MSVHVASILFQPIPILTMLATLNGVTAVTRQWAGDDHRRCGLCTECTASDSGVCNILTEEIVSSDDAPLYSSLDVDFVVADATVRDLAPLGLAR